MMRTVYIQIHTFDACDFHTVGRAHINCSRSSAKLYLLPSSVIVKSFECTLVLVLSRVFDLTCDTRVPATDMHVEPPLLSSCSKIRKTSSFTHLLNE